MTTNWRIKSVNSGDTILHWLAYWNDYEGVD